jgi:hypothetical protein
MLRLLIGMGMLLMAIGFGAAGWQYWQTQSGAASAVAVADPAADPARQVWLISSSGVPVPQDLAQAYLVQDMFTPRRVVEVTRQALLADLLVAGEALPEEPYLQVLADIRAPLVAKGLCNVMLRLIASDCAVNTARVVEGSVEPAAGTAMFRLELVFRLKDAGTEVPDLATHVFRSETVALDLEAGAEGTASPDAALGVLVAAATAACEGDSAGELCRPTRFSLTWVAGQPVVAEAGIGWLDQMPEGMLVAPPLEPESGD